ncbi:CRISPR-associated endoribonuclease Cas6 [Paraclostridium bifermentans]|uniref:CRISPR-associated endoribonuclease Cas6 n=1 Tax=Paraclostridium bifermentans TaxID=1490 RepID=UPI001C80806D|nr:CRISPR-associated endoribonuclease Cas6 [Paraclostridium bifermentans]GIM33281.1 CRISPR-associated endoribonuclease Cas6 [Paraclostridium bifermentans subsp. muricolitidis]
MRVKIEFKTDKLPISYNTLFMSVIKEAIRKSSEEYYNNLYYYENKSNKKTKNFTFAVYVKGYDIKNENFIIKDKVILNISTPDLELGLNIYNGLINYPKFIYKDYELKRIRVDLGKEKIIYKEEVIFNALSPICIKSKSGKFLNIEDCEYEKEFNYISNEILKNYRGYGLKKDLSFEDVRLSKVVVKESLREFKNTTGKLYQYVNGYKGRFKLFGDIEDLNDLYKIGVGFKRSQGFGYIDLIE